MNKISKVEMDGIEYYLERTPNKLYRWKASSDQRERESRTLLSKDPDVWTGEWKFDPPMMIFNTGEPETIDVMVASKKHKPPTHAEAMAALDALKTGTSNDPTFKERN